MLVTANAEWNEFSKLVEAAMREEKSVVERNQEKETVNSISGSKSPSPSTDRRSNEGNKRFALGVSSKGTFKSKHGGTLGFNSSSSREIKRTRGTGRFVNPLGDARIKQPEESTASIRGRSLCSVCNIYHCRRCHGGTHTCYKCG